MTSRDPDPATTEMTLLERFTSSTEHDAKSDLRRVLVWGPPSSGKATLVSSICRLVWRRAPVTIACMGQAPHAAVWWEVGPSAARTRLTTTDDEHSRYLRRALLASVHGIIFVADSALVRARDNAVAADELAEIWSELGAEGRPAKPPVLLCANKRDLPFALPVELIREDLGALDVLQTIETVAPSLTNGELLEWMAALDATFRIAPATDPPPASFSRIQKSAVRPPREEPLSTSEKLASRNTG
jgi:GTPase SAR1 family protein